MIGLTIDPGLETGVCLFEWGDDQPFKVVKLWQFGNGAEGLAAFLRKLGLRPNPGTTLVRPAVPPHVEFWNGAAIRRHQKLDALVVEKFTPRPNENFAPTRKSVEPLRGEGVVLGLALGPFIQWREPKQQYFMSPPDTPLEQMKKDARAFLETFDMLPTGSVVGRPNADDAISATLHAISWLRAQRHRPTLLKFFPPHPLERN